MTDLKRLAHQIQDPELREQMLRTLERTGVVPVLTYHMQAWHEGLQTTVHWQIDGMADLTGQFSGCPPDALVDIRVCHTSDIPARHMRAR